MLLLYLNYGKHERTHYKVNVGENIHSCVTIVCLPEDVLRRVCLVDIALKSIKRYSVLAIGLTEVT